MQLFKNFCIFANKNAMEKIVERILSVPLYKTDGKKEKKVLATFVHLYSRWKWYCIEASREADDIIMFCYVISGLGEDCDEFGYVSFNELKSIPNIFCSIEENLYINSHGKTYRKHL